MNFTDLKYDKQNVPYFPANKPMGLPNFGRLTFSQSKQFLSPWAYKNVSPNNTVRGYDQ